MSQSISKAGVLARVVLLNAAGAVTTKLPDGVTPSWSVSDAAAFQLVPAADGLSVAVTALAENGTAATLTFTAGSIIATSDIVQTGAAPAPDVAVSASITFEALPTAG